MTGGELVGGEGERSKSSSRDRAPKDSVPTDSWFVALRYSGDVRCALISRGVYLMTDNFAVMVITASGQKGETWINVTVDREK